jgi:nucleoside-diphosphate-sugar epimerase
MRILVLGGTRFIGPDVVRRLDATGHRVTIFHRGQTEADLPPGVAHLHGDRQRLAGHADEFRRLAPEVVLDMLPLGEGDAQAVVRAFRGIARRAVAVSSADVYRAYGRLIGTEPGPPDPVPLAEDAPLREKLYPYRGETARAADDPARRMDDYDKILVERTVLGNPDLPGTILRLPMVYGPRDGQHRLFPYLKRMDDGRPAIILGEGLARWRAGRGYAEDIAVAIALATVDDRAAGRIYNVGEADALPEADWVRAVGRAAGWTGEVAILPPDRLPAHLQAKGDPAQSLVADTARIRRELGYAEAVSRDEALRRTIAWERAHPPEAVDPSRFDYAAEDAALAAVSRGGG